MDAEGVKAGRAAAIYALLFVILTWPAITRFNTHFFADQGDGVQNIWNLWWVNQAVTVLHQNPWRTTYLHYPYGTSLVGHTLNPFNGFVAVPFLQILPLVTVHNAIVAFAFIAGGLTAFLLAYHLSGDYWPSILAGFVFTFSSFHFEHAEGHLQLVSLEWIPLFVLLWLRLIDGPTIGRGVRAALVLFLVLLCDHYYFLYCVMTGAIVLGWKAVRDGGVSRLLDRRLVSALTVFVIVSLGTSGVLVGSLLLSHARDPLVGAHPAVDFSLDALAPFIYGGHWRFADLTSAYWLRLSTNYHESSVHVGYSVIVLMLYAWLRRRALPTPILNLFALLFFVFLILALGPILQFGGKEILGHRALLPYALLQKLLPFLSVSGVPIRMMVMVTLSAAVISAFGFGLLWRGTRRDRGWAIALAVLLFVEYLPKPIPTVRTQMPEYVRVLRDLPGADGVLDTISPETLSLAYQAMHEKPLAFGYIARLPQSVANKDRQLEEVIRGGRFDRLWPEYRLRYVVGQGETARTLRAWPGATTVWNDGELGVFDVSGLPR